MQLTWMSRTLVGSKSTFLTFSNSQSINLVRYFTKESPQCQHDLQVPEMSMVFSRQEYWNGLPCPPPGDLPDSGIEPISLLSPALAGGFCTTSAPWEVPTTSCCCCCCCCCVASVVSDSVRPHTRQPSGSSVFGILQARTLEWVAISFSNACMHAKSLQSCPTLCDPMDSSPPGSPVPGILQARTLEWVAISFSSA